MIEDLLALADELANRDTGRPRQASLRRAVATTYYALFHALAKMCADQLVGKSKPWDVYTPVYRSVDHAVARKVLREARSHAAGQPIAAIGPAFLELHDKRIAADYMPAPLGYSRKEIIDLIQEARGAITALDALEPDTKLRLAVQLITKTR
ncbi:MAG: hypothetical protein ACR652_05705 [Methylocystis sp.]|uniref:hypothetical protein n=1 Tax=Methylocystis sp. TaxID=1911079 RepID=UPI003DA689CC